MAKIIKSQKKSLLQRFFKALSGMNGNPFNRTDQYFAGSIRGEKGFKK